jgi:hypothetical protein
MAIVELPPLDHRDACELATMLLNGESIKGDKLDETANEIASSVDRVPFYIHHVVDQIETRGDRVTAGLIEEIVLGLLTDPHDPWHMRYYRERLSMKVVKFFFRKLFHAA